VLCRYDGVRRGGPMARAEPSPGDRSRPAFPARLSIAAFLVMAFLAAGGMGAQEGSGPAFGGSVRAQAYASYSGSGTAEESDFGYGSSTTFAIDFDSSGSRSRASASLEAAVLSGEAARAAWLRIAAGQVPTDEFFMPESRPDAGPDLLAAARIRTLYVKLNGDWYSLTAGRQVINYERGALWSPTDLFTELDLTGLSPVRLGSDAIRLTLPLGATAAADAAAAPSSSPSEGRYSARLSALLLGVDGAVTVARDGAARTTLVGADFKADLELGVYGDAVYALPDSGGPGSVRAALGADWSLGDFIVAAEYYYNGGGRAADGLFPDTHNLYADLLWRLTEFSSLSASSILDLSGRSGQATLLSSFSAAQGTTVSLYLQGLWGASLPTLACQAGAIIELAF